ncbi:MAG: hypothetical protein CR997_05665 [Acidobacteria bacterium]|nr:MAG: hypothetical protein CR997_05665 [Acidobacteriota bacterium]
MNKLDKVVLMFVLALLTMTCGPSSSAHDQNRNKNEFNKQEKAVPIAVQKPRRGMAYAYYATTAVLEAEHRAEIRAKTGGVILDLFVEEGDLLKKGATMLKLEDSDQKLKLKQARLTFQQAQKEFKRHTKMKNTGVLSQELYEQSENNYLQASADLEVAELNLSYTEVKAPLAGICVKRRVDLGTHIDLGTPLFDIMDMDPMLLRVHVPANRMDEIELGQELEMSIDSTGDRLKGVIQLISPIVDSETGTVKITAAVRNYPDSVRPGDFAEIRLITEKKEDAMLVPSIAVFEEKGQSVVFIAVQGKAVRKAVTVGLVTEKETEILTGIDMNDHIVVKGQRGLRDGQKVTILDTGEDQTVK